MMGSLVMYRQRGSTLDIWSTPQWRLNIWRPSGVMRIWPSGSSGESFTSGCCGSGWFARSGVEASALVASGAAAAAAFSFALLALASAARFFGVFFCLCVDRVVYLGAEVGPQLDPVERVVEVEQKVFAPVAHVVVEGFFFHAFRHHEPTIVQAPGNERGGQALGPTEVIPVLPPGRQAYAGQLTHLLQALVVALGPAAARGIGILATVHLTLLAAWALMKSSGKVLHEKQATALNPAW